jgi:hypothetical protein
LSQFDQVADEVVLVEPLRIPTMPISRSSGSRSVIPIDPDQRGVSAPLDAFLISVFGPDVKHG